jgi:ribosomal protein RSM22 (predicted rRNA methylase)
VTHEGHFAAWMQALEARHFADLAFSEVSRALRALSSTYVERRQRLHEGAALSGAGKRAAFALFYGPLHYLLVREIVRELGAAATSAATLVDLGCGTGASGAAWASAFTAPPRVVAVDRHPWALGEAAWTYRAFSLSARTRQDDVSRATLPKARSAILAAFTVNELPDAARDALLARLLDRAAQGDRLLIVEPVARFVARWWPRWRDAFVEAGGRADQWRFRPELPPLLVKFDRAAGLNHGELTGRSLWIGGRDPADRL